MKIIFYALNIMLDAFINQHLCEIAVVIDVEVATRHQGIVQRLLIIIEVKVELDNNITASCLFLNFGSRKSDSLHYLCSTYQ
jgi:hypothetical protein